MKEGYVQLGVYNPKYKIKKIEKIVNFELKSLNFIPCSFISSFKYFGNHLMDILLI